MYKIYYEKCLYSLFRVDFKACSYHFLSFYNVIYCVFFQRLRCSKHLAIEIKCLEFTVKRGQNILLIQFSVPSWTLIMGRALNSNKERRKVLSCRSFYRIVFHSHTCMSIIGKGLKAGALALFTNFFLPFLLLYRLIVSHFQSNFYRVQMPGPPNIE